jgi:hypothetical protein
VEPTVLQDLNFLHKADGHAMAPCFLSETNEHWAFCKSVLSLLCSHLQDALRYRTVILRTWSVEKAAVSLV